MKPDHAIDTSSGDVNIDFCVFCETVHREPDGGPALCPKAGMTVGEIRLMNDPGFQDFVEESWQRFKPMVDALFDRLDHRDALREWDRALRDYG